MARVVRKMQTALVAAVGFVIRMLVHKRMPLGFMMQRRPCTNAKRVVTLFVTMVFVPLTDINAERDAMHRVITAQTVFVGPTIVQMELHRFDKQQMISSDVTMHRKIQYATHIIQMSDVFEIIRLLEQIAN